ncbi:non-hydrolyzing UDP-N-acetylglucosamine 2-epimerase [Candidatus Methylopumilus planktonicus]|uniref:non-hydrolyzing UDP-N-acetylglucosamine 2-epimerase n=1 Tax=Candidatus Methylopumilus planktonicus TaxID=1581557 RepID=UPI003BEEC0EC
MKKLKVLTLVGTRPEIIRLSRVIEKLDTYCDHVFVHTGQNYDVELSQVFFYDLKLREPDYYLDASGSSAAETIGNIISKVDSVLVKEMPDAVLILGDTNSCLGAISAKRRKIPIFHMEAGNRCFDFRVPEEINRRIVDHIADINLTYSSIAREYLLKEGLPADMVIKVGSPMKEVFNFYRNEIESSDILGRLNLTKNQYFLISAHREENIESIENFNKLVHLLNSIADKYNYPVIVSTHPRTRKKIEEQSANFHEAVRLLKPLGYIDYNQLQLCAKVTLSDSGTITEESTLMGFPALNIRDTHERPEGMEEAAVMLVGLNMDRVIQSIEILNNSHIKDKSLIHTVSDYNVDNVSEKIVRIIHSYTDYVNRVVWKKY